MDEVLQEIIEVCVIPFLGIVAGVLIKFIKIKADEFCANSKNETEKKYINMISETISECVIATNQTFVEGLKKENAFDEEAQKKAFAMTLEAVLDVLSDDAKDYMTEVSGDVNVYLKNKIEAEVNLNK